MLPESLCNSRNRDARLLCFMLRLPASIASALGIVRSGLRVAVLWPSRRREQRVFRALIWRRHLAASQQCYGAAHLIVIVPAGIATRQV
jgi:hypothetical protein